MPENELFARAQNALSNSANIKLIEHKKLSNTTQGMFVAACVE